MRKLTNTETSETASTAQVTNLFSKFNILRVWRPKLVNFNYNTQIRQQQICSFEDTFSTK